MTTYPIFEQCAEMTEDEYWKKLFLQCSLNKFPIGLRYDPVRSVLSIRKDGTKKPSNILLSLDDVKKVYDTFMYIFRDTLSLRSFSDQQEQKKEMKKLSKQRSKKKNDTWKDVKLKHDKTEMILEFSESVAKNIGGDAKYIAACINDSLRFSRITADDFVIEDGKIITIHNLDYVEEDERYLVVPVLPMKLVKEKNENKLSTLLQKQIKAYVKRVNTEK